MVAPIPPRSRRPDHFKHWEMFLTSGFDFFNDLGDIGLDAQNLPRGAARAAWRQYGKQIMATFEPSPHRPKPWGLLKFGRPE